MCILPLAPMNASGHMTIMENNPAPYEIFDAKRQRINRARRSVILAQQSDADFLSNVMADDIIARLEVVTRPMTKAVIIGNCTSAILDWCERHDVESVTIDMAANSTSPRHIICDHWDNLPELPFQPDLVIMTGVLDSANDVPGLLIQLRAILKPDGLFLCGFLGAGSLAVLKRAMLVADGDSPSAHIHPQIDVRAAGDLMSRAGFALPVADLDMLTIKYRNIAQLLHDIRCFGGGNALAAGITAFNKGKWQRLADHLVKQAAKDGKIPETFAFISLSGWAPSPDQPKPARRGSASVSLASQLGKKTG